MVGKKHVCHLDLGSNSFLPERGRHWCRLCRSFRELCQVSERHPLTYHHLYSYPAVMAEKQRQLVEGRSCLIHPFSLFSLAWKSFMVVVNLAHMVLSTFRLFFIIDPHYHQNVHFCDQALVILNSLCWLDLGINFNMGYLEKGPEGSIIILDRQLIICNYLRTWFACDLVSTMPIGYILLTCHVSSRHMLMAHILPLFRIARIGTVVRNFTIFVKIFTISYVIYGSIRNAMLFCLMTHSCGCLLYLPAVFSFYWNGKFNAKHTQFLDLPPEKTILDIYVMTRYSISIFISLSGFFGTGFSMFLASEPDEMLMHSLIILYSTLFMVYYFVFFLKVYITIYSSTVRYHELVNQVEEYMRLKQFPVPLKKRVRAFYYYRYQEQYFSENNVLGSLSEELRNEITLHTCHKLVEQVRLFEDVPASVVGSVLGCLHAEVYLAEDSVLHAGDIGDCMYFIANGTVAVYSLKGVEVCHLEDGAHFGEVALLMKDSKRVATVVAVEITQVYRLDVEDFKKFILSNELMYERIAALASKRMHETVLLDEDFRRERERLQENQQSSSTII